MKSYLTINQFAKMRNIHPSSLRYYEKLGILIPAYIDPKTKYRYYRPEQQFTLDIILLCIDLNINLKELPNYMEQDEVFIQKLLEDGAELARRRAEEIENSLRRIDYALQRQEQNREFLDMALPYKRTFPARSLILKEYPQPIGNFAEIQSAATPLRSKAREQGLTPVLFACVLFQIHNGTMKQYVGFELLDPAPNENVIELPVGEYQCFQMALDAQDDLQHMMQERFGNGPDRTILIANMVQNDYCPEKRKGEIQIWDQLCEVK